MLAGGGHSLQSEVSAPNPFCFGNWTLREALKLQFSLTSFCKHLMVMESSGDEYEPFQVTEEDQLAERFPRRRRRRQTREDRIYGMWAQHDSDDEDGRWGEREGVCVERRRSGTL